MRTARKTIDALLIAYLCGACDAFASSGAWRPAAARVLSPPSARAVASPRPRLASVSMQTEPKAAETNAEAEDGSGGIRQLLGLKGASTADSNAFLNWKIRLQLMKPATWVPLIWGVACGAAASGNYHAIWNLFGDAPTTSSAGEVAIDTVKAFSAMILAGPFSKCKCRAHSARPP